MSSFLRDWVHRSSFFKIDYHFFIVSVSSCSILILSHWDAVRLSLLCVLAVIANLVQFGFVAHQSGVLRPFGVLPGIPEVCDTHVANLPVTVPAMSGIAFISRKFEHSITTLTFLEVLFLCLGHGLAGQNWMRHARTHPAPVPAHELASEESRMEKELHYAIS